MFEPHEGLVALKNDFISAYTWLKSLSEISLVTDADTRFTACANIGKRGQHFNHKVIRFYQEGVEYGRSYECCWGHYYNCNRTRIGMYCKALDACI